MSRNWTLLTYRRRGMEKLGAKLGELEFSFSINKISMNWKYFRLYSEVDQVLSNSSPLRFNLSKFVLINFICTILPSSKFDLWVGLYGLSWSSSVILIRQVQRNCYQDKLLLLTRQNVNLSKSIQLGPVWSLDENQFNAAVDLKNDLIKISLINYLILTED